MQQGEVYTVGHQTHFLIVSSAAFNQWPDMPVVWGVPSTHDGYDPAQLTHIDRRLLTAPVATCELSTLTRVLQFLHWGFVGSGPFEDAADERGTPEQPADVDQGDVVIDSDGQMMVIVSGAGFNNTFGTETLWTMAAEENGMVHPHLVMTRTRPELRATPIEIPADGVRHNVDLIVHNILGLN